MCKLWVYVLCIHVYEYIYTHVRHTKINLIAQTLKIWLDGSGLPDAVRIERRAAVPMQLHYVSHRAMEASCGGKLPPQQLAWRFPHDGFRLDSEGERAPWPEQTGGMYPVKFKVFRLIALDQSSW